ncbi:hypothetical protein UY3_07379 [Chelonia mydas]|uniref:Uncharacterized protein n=1 Tax=Chelonia mydas TaxID=8469 RepID=M7BBU9_CHEMY|nr:hypothetical protein UY3_07379 [Chelonia mydas]
MPAGESRARRLLPHTLAGSSGHFQGESWSQDRQGACLRPAAPLTGSRLRLEQGQLYPFCHPKQLTELLPPRETEEREAAAAASSSRKKLPPICRRGQLKREDAAELPPLQNCPNGPHGLPPLSDRRPKYLLGTLCCPEPPASLFDQVSSYFGTLTGLLTVQSAVLPGAASIRSKTKHLVTRTMLQILSFEALYDCDFCESHTTHKILEAIQS